MSQGNKIVIKDFNFYYQSFQALRNISLNIHSKEIFAIFGPARSGKTTLLKSLNRLADLIFGTKHTGSIFLDGADIYDPQLSLTQLRRRIGMVFDLPTALPMSIFDNVAYGPKLNKITQKRRLAEMVEKALRSAVLWEEVKDRLHTSALRLSGGQQQRLCIARILALEPEVLLLDEPMAGMNLEEKEDIARFIIDIFEGQGDTYPDTPVLRDGVSCIVLVEHDMGVVMDLADRIAVLDFGRKIAEGTPEEIKTNPQVISAYLGKEG